MAVQLGWLQLLIKLHALRRSKIKPYSLEAGGTLDIEVATGQQVSIQRSIERQKAP